MLNDRMRGGEKGDDGGYELREVAILLACGWEVREGP
jgi:hypothetical protein